jgi:hypothetical protein
MSTKASPASLLAKASLIWNSEGLCQFYQLETISRSLSQYTLRHTLQHN